MCNRLGANPPKTLSLLLTEEAASETYADYLGSVFDAQIFQEDLAACAQQIDHFLQENLKPPL